MLLLDLIWKVAAVLILVALAMWLLLILVSFLASRRDIRMASCSEEWLDRLLDVLEGVDPVGRLPVPQSWEETDAVIRLLRMMAERFSGSYNDRMVQILDHIKAKDYGMRMLKSTWNNNKVRGCALLGWCGPDPNVDDRIREMLSIRDSRVVLEAASALVRRGAVDDIGGLIHALCRSRACKSLLAHDLLKRWAAAEPSDWSRLLSQSWSSDGLRLLLDAAGAAGKPEWVPLIEGHLDHEDPLVVKAALSALCQLGDPLGAPGALVSCSHPHPSVRVQALKTLQACADLDEAQGVLFERLGDDSFEVRQWALRVMIGLGGREKLQSIEPVDRWQIELFREAEIRGV